MMRGEDASHSLRRYSRLKLVCKKIRPVETFLCGTMCSREIGTVRYGFSAVKGFDLAAVAVPNDSLLFKIDGFAQSAFTASGGLTPWVCGTPFFVS